MGSLSREESKLEEKRTEDFGYRLWRYDGEPGELIPLLQAAQDHYGYVPEHAIRYISSVTGVPEAQIYGVTTFYAQFRLTPRGKHVVRVCVGTACHVSGAKGILDVIEDELGIHEGETTEDGLFSLFGVACIGCCSLAPVMVIDEETHGSLNSKKARQAIKKIRRLEAKGASQSAAV